MANMVWCLGCRRVVWAYDHAAVFDLRGWLNQARMPCRLCGDEGNYDGWAGEWQPYMRGYNAKFDEPPDLWGCMRAKAKARGLEWCPSGDNRWFAKGREDAREESQCLLPNLGP